MEPFKVTFKLSAPVLRDSEYPVHLDALIAFAVMREHEDNVVAAGTSPWKEAEDLSAFLERTTGENWVWKASALQFNPDGRRLWVNNVRRADPERYFEDLGTYWVGRGKKNDLGINLETFKIDTRSGQQRGYQWFSGVQWMKEVVAWGVGDIQSVQDLLSRQITHLGKKGSNGYGVVSSVEVVPAPPQESDNWMLRILPDGMDGKPGVQYEPVIACVRAPYWRKTDRVMALEPMV